MKKVILWLIKFFHVDIPTEKIVKVENEAYLPHEGVIDGDITIKGNVIVTGNMKVEGRLTIASKEV